MPPEEADSTEGTAKPRQLAEPEECPGGAKIKPPFEMGVSDFELLPDIEFSRCIAKIHVRSLSN